MHTLIADIAARYQLRRRGRRWVGQCPECGGSAKSDKFVLFDDGGFKCHACPFKGDMVKWLKEREGMSCPEAKERLGLRCEVTSCAVYQNCRLGEGKGGGGRISRRKLSPRDLSQHQELATADDASPQQCWNSWAEHLVESAHERLLNNEAELAYLAGRGIDRNSVLRFHLGWLGKSLQVERARIGLPSAQEKKNPHLLWVPAGLVIPILDDLGQVHRVRVRRPKASREKFLPDLKYLWIEGAGKAPLVIRPASGELRGVVVVEAELDAFACAAAHADVMVIALGTVRGGLTEQLKAELAKAQVILVALDADPGKENAQGKRIAAGPAAIATWCASYRQARFYPVPQEKDAGEYAKTGKLHLWIEAGLPPRRSRRQKQQPGIEHPQPASTPTNDRPEPASHEQNLCPVCDNRGGEGEKRNSSPDALDENAPWQVTLINGRSFWVVKDQATWLSLVAEGEVVFSENELLRLQEATATMAPTERLEAALKVLDVKEEFGHAYIRRGERIDESAEDTHEENPTG